MSMCGALRSVSEFLARRSAARRVFTLDPDPALLPTSLRRATVMDALAHTETELGHTAGGIARAQVTLGFELRAEAAAIGRRIRAGIEDERRLRAAAIRHHRRVLDLLDGVPVIPAHFGDLLDMVAAAAGIEILADAYVLIDAVGQRIGDPIPADEVALYADREELRQAAQEQAEEIGELWSLVLALLSFDGTVDAGDVDGRLDADILPDLAAGPLDADVLDPDGLLRKRYRRTIAERRESERKSPQPTRPLSPLAAYDEEQATLDRTLARQLEKMTSIAPVLLFTPMRTREDKDDDEFQLG